MQNIVCITKLWLDVQKFDIKAIQEGKTIQCKPKPKRYT